MKTTIDLPEDLVRAVKLRAVLQRRSVKDLVAEYIRQGLGMSPPDATTPTEQDGSRVSIGEGWLPVFQCRRDAPAATLTVEELLTLEREVETEEDQRRAGLTL